MPGMTNPGPYGYDQLNTMLPTQPGKTAPMPGAGTQDQNQYAWNQTPFGQMMAKRSYAGGGMVSPAGTPLPNGPMPVDEGKIAYERELESAKKAFELSQTGADAAARRSSDAAREGETLGEKGATFNYDLGQRGADANQQRLFDAFEKMGITGSGGALSQSGAAPPRVAGDDSAWGAMQAAAGGRAKDQAAAAVGAARRAMLNNMSSRGISGSGIEAKQDMGIQLAGAGQLGEAGRQLAEQTGARQAAVSDRNYSGDITQRGQDIQAQQAKYSLLPSLMSLFRVSASY